MKRDNIRNYENNDIGYNLCNDFSVSTIGNNFFLNSSVIETHHNFFFFLHHNFLKSTYIYYVESIMDRP